MKKNPDSSISSFHTTIHSATTYIVPYRNGTSSYYRSQQKTHSSTHLQVDMPYIALNSETYISLRHQELRKCKHVDYEFYHEELFVVKHKSKCSCERGKGSNLSSEILNKIVT